MKKTLRTIAIAAAALLTSFAVGAQTFGPEIRVSANPGPSLHPAIAISGNNVYVVWAENFANGAGGSFQADILFNRSVDGGATFLGAVNLTNSPGTNDTLPVIAAGGNQVHIFWTNNPNTGDVLYTRSTDAGATFAAVVQMTPSDGSYSLPQGALVDASGNVHLAFADNRPPAGSYGQVFYQCSSNQGASFGAAVNITQFDGVVDNEAPRLSQGTDGTLYMIFRTTRAGTPQGGWPPFELYMMRSAAPVTNCAFSWLRPSQRVTKGLPAEWANSFGGNIVAGANNVLHATYWSDKLGTNLTYRRGFPLGKGWEAPIDISGFGPDHPEWDGNIPVVTGHGLGEDALGRLHAIFGDNNHLREGFQVGSLYYRCSPDNGVTWAARTFAAGQTETAMPRGVYGNGKFHVVWMDWRDNNSGAEIYYKNIVGGCAGGGARLTDLNGDGKSDLLYRNFTTGQLYRMLMNGFTITNQTMAYTEPNTAWKVINDGDFNGDGVTDLLWRNSTDGRVFYQPFNTSGLPVGGTVFYTEPNAAWKIIHTPDLDGDGKADILWYNTSTGQVFAMLMNAAAIQSQGIVYTEPNLAWSIVAVGDFAGAGKKNQLLWRNSSTGQVYLMTVTVAGGVFSQTGVMIYTEPNLSWKIIDVADFNGDGKSDILYRNDATGQVFMMLMNGGVISSQGMVYTEPNLQWKIVSVGDYNGDGKADILYRNDTTGQVFMMLMNGLATTSSQIVYTEPNTQWRLLGPWEYSQ